jgi:putative ABC transport system ATP-binding protein
MFRLKGVKYKNILDINQLMIPANKVTCIVGESGSGKTTLLRLLNKMISCTEGEIYYNNEAISAINSIELRRKIVMLPQTPAIFTGTVKDNLLIGLKFSEKPLINDEKLIEVLKMVHLNKPLEENANKLSGGEKQRLALGRVILMEPTVFLLDEPSSALDEDTERIIIEQLIHYTRQNNKTLIMVTHSKKIAQTYSDNIVEIRNGKVVNQKGE